MLVDPRCRCLASGRYYELVAGDNCQSYITYTATSSPTSFSCGAGTILDVSACICNHQSLVTCPQQCVTQGNNCQLKTTNYTSSILVVVQRQHHSWLVCIVTILVTYCLNLRELSLMFDRYYIPYSMPDVLTATVTAFIGLMMYLIMF